MPNAVAGRRSSAQRDPRLDQPSKGRDGTADPRQTRDEITVSAIAADDPHTAPHQNRPHLLAPPRTLEPSARRSAAPDPPPPWSRRSRPRRPASRGSQWQATAARWTPAIGQTPAIEVTQRKSSRSEPTVSGRRSAAREVPAPAQTWRSRRMPRSRAERAPNLRPDRRTLVTSGQATEEDIRGLALGRQPDR